MRNALQYFFHGPCNDYCEIVDEGSSDLSIIDLDGLTGQQCLEDHQTRNPEKPLILLSVDYREIKDAILIRKPLKSEILISALKAARKKVLRSNNLSDNNLAKKPTKITLTNKPVSILKEKVSGSVRNPDENNVVQNISGSGEVLQPQVSTEEEINKVPITNTTPHQTTAFHKLHAGHCYIGSAPDIDLNDSSQLEKAQYDPEIYFQSYIAKAVIKARNSAQSVLLTIPDGWIVIRPDTQTVLIDIQDSKLRAFSAVPISDETITKSIIDDSNLTKYTKLATSITLEQLLWKSALWSSRGRVPIGTNLTLPISLKNWPNLSRLLLSPHALRISALWSEYPCSLLDTAKNLQIPQRYVFAFYSACNAIGIVSVEQDSAEAISKTMPKKMNNKRAFLGRLLERLKAYTK